MYELSDCSYSSIQNSSSLHVPAWYTVRVTLTLKKITETARTNVNREFVRFLEAAFGIKLAKFITRVINSNEFYITSSQLVMVTGFYVSLRARCIPFRLDL